MTEAATPRPDGPRPRAVVVGPPGSGKTTVARALARRWAVTSRDTDADVERTAGRSISDLFVDEGEAYFRDLEQQAVAVALAEHDGVLALGGGAVLDPRTEQALVEYGAAGGHVVFLDVTLTHAAPRVGMNTARPLLLGNPRGQWLALMQARRPVYERVATVHVLTDGLTPDDVATRVVDAVATAEAARTGSGGREAPGGPVS